MDTPSNAGSTRKIVNYSVPLAAGIRLDDGVYEGFTVSAEYDPMLGKLIAWGSGRAEAIARMKRALGEYYAGGIKTNVALFQRILGSQDFESGAIYTRWLDDFLLKKGTSELGAIEGKAGESANESAVAIALALWHGGAEAAKNADGHHGSAESPSRWKADGRFEQMNKKLGS